MNKASARRNGLRIIVAEDEPLAAMVIEDALTEFGHTVLLAADGKEALEHAETEPFDLLITDLAMPRLSGWELIPRLRARRPDLPVVVMTGFLPPGSRSVLVTDPDAPFELVLKPFEMGQLLAAIDKVIGQGDTARPAEPVRMVQRLA